MPARFTSPEPVVSPRLLAPIAIRIRWFPMLLALMFVAMLHVGSASALPATSVSVIDVYPGAGSSHPEALIAMDNRLYFGARDGLCGGAGTAGFELRSVGPSGDAQLVKDINTATSGNCDGYAGPAAVLQSKLVFEARNNPFSSNATGFEPWVSDGTEAGTTLLKDIYRGSDPSFPFGFTTVLDGTRVVFGAEQPLDGYDPEPWITDGTSVGTRRIADVAPGEYGSFPQLFTPLSSSQFVFVGTDDPSSGQRNAVLWASDGSSVQFLYDFSAGGDGVEAIAPFAGRDLVLISANDGASGYEPWVSDGTAAGTFRLADLVPGVASSSPRAFTQVGDQMFFWANDGVHGEELWVSDGTQVGTRLVKDIRAGTLGSFAGSATAFNGLLFFGASDGTTGLELWVSDGTTAGTVLFADLTPGSLGTTPRWLTVVGGSLFFTGAGPSIWLSDGTLSGTGQIASGFDNPVDLTAIGSSVLAFVATDPSLGREVHLVKLANEPPEIEPIVDATSDEHVLVQITPNVTDPEGDPYTLTWEGLPPGGVSDGGVLSWTPSEEQGPGIYEITVTATQDGAPAQYDSETFVINVLEVNEPPVLDPIPDVTVLTGDTVSFEATATDPDIPENSLTFSLGAAPAGATLAPLKPAEFSWTACSCPSGDYPVEVIVSDGELSDTLPFTIHVQNRPPQIGPIGDATIPEGSPIQIQPLVSDPEGDTWTLAWSGDVPPNAAINGIFSWTPDEAQGPGDYTITVTATQDSEPGLTASETFTVTVEEVNQPPVLQPIGPRSGVEGVPIEFQATATDPDIPLETLQYAMTPLAGDLSGASIDADTGEFACACATGQHLVRIWVTDGSLADFEDVEISVEATSSADLQVSLLPSVPGQHFVGDAVPYTVLVHNAGPDAATAELTVEPEHHDQATWGAVPPEAAINGIFFLAIDEIAAGATVPVEFEIVYGAFGLHDLTATVSGSHEEPTPADNVAGYEQQVDLSLDTPGVETGGLSIGGAKTTDGEPLAVFGVSVPSWLIAGDPGWNLFLPSDLTPAELIPGQHFLPGDQWIPGQHFLPGDQWIPGQHFLPGDQWIPGQHFLPGDQWIPGQHFLSGVVLIPALDGSSKLPPGRLLFSDGSGTDALVSELGDTSLRVERAWPSKITPGGLSVTQAEGGALEGSVALCGGGFQAHLGPGNGAGFECGSLTSTVLTGHVSIELGDTLLTAPAGAVVHVDEADGGGWNVTVNVGGPITLTDDGGTTELSTGESTHVAAAGAPTAEAGGPYLGAIDAQIVLDGSASSDADDEPLAYAWSADGGTIAESTSVTPSFTASAAGIYALTLEVCDPSGACDTAITSVVVYDPSAGFVTGGGWIDSEPGSCGPAAPEGACIGDPTGRATFGFVSRYRKGAEAPDGQTEFVFQAGGLRFHSDRYAWLLVAGKDRAQFKGIGSVNGVDGYEFMLTAYDSGGTDPDGFRIKIWNEIGVVYDNRSGADDSLTVANTQAIGGGSIVIHRK